MKSSLDLDVAIRGSFAHKTPMEGREVLDHLLENSSSLTTIMNPAKRNWSRGMRVSQQPNELSPFTSQDSSIEPSLKPRTPKEEEIHPLEFSS
jgi:hypothetical protein